MVVDRNWAIGTTTLGVMTVDYIMEAKVMVTLVLIAIHLFIGIIISGAFLGPDDRGLLRDDWEIIERCVGWSREGTYGERLYSPSSAYILELQMVLDSLDSKHMWPNLCFCRSPTYEEINTGFFDKFCQMAELVFLFWFSAKGTIVFQATKESFVLIQVDYDFADEDAFQVTSIGLSQAVFDCICESVRLRIVVRLRTAYRSDIEFAGGAPGDDAAGCREGQFVSDAFLLARSFP